MSRPAIINDILSELDRQLELKAAGKFNNTCADDVSDGFRLAVLTEEVGEVARELCQAEDRNEWPGENLRKELIQVAAVCISWIDGIDKYGSPDEREELRKRDTDIEGLAVDQLEKVTRKCYNCGKPCGPEACPRCAVYERDDG